MLSMLSSLVAKAQVDGANLYLLRNSFGSECNEYTESINNRCDCGHFWLTEIEIRKYVTTVAYYLKKSK